MASATYNSDLTHDGLSAVIESVEQLTINEDEVSAIPGLSVRDVDLDVDGAYIFGGDPGSVDAGVVEVTLYASNGTTSLRAELNEYTFLVGDGVDDGIMSFRASLGGANRALAGLTYRGKIDFYGTDDIVVTVDDGGRFGRGSLCEESAMRGAGELDGSYAACPQVTSPKRRSIICRIPLGFGSESRQLNRISGSSEFGNKMATNSTGCIQYQKSLGDAAYWPRENIYSRNVNVVCLGLLECGSVCLITKMEGIEEDGLPITESNVNTPFRINR